MSDHPHHTLAAEHVLGLLDGDDRRRAEALAATDAGFAAEVEVWRQRLAELDATARPVMPGADLWTRIAGHLDGKETVGRAGEDTGRTTAVVPVAFGRRMWSSLPVWRGVGGVALAACVLLAIGLATALREVRRQPVLVAVLVGDGDGPGAIVNAFADGRTELVPLRAVDVPAGRALQVWTLWDRARGPVSVGLIEAMRGLDLGVGGLPRAAPDQLFEITLEPAGGSPTGRPTGPILMKGTTSRTL